MSEAVFLVVFCLLVVVAIWAIGSWSWSLIRLLTRLAFWRGLGEFVLFLPRATWFLIKAAIVLVVGVLVIVLGSAALPVAGSIGGLAFLIIWAINIESAEANRRHRELLAALNETPAERSARIFIDERHYGPPDEQDIDAQPASKLDRDSWR